MNTSDATNTSFGLMVMASSPIGRHVPLRPHGRPNECPVNTHTHTHTSTHALFTTVYGESSVSPLSSGHNKVSTRVLERCKLTNYMQASGQSLQLPGWL